MTTADDTIVALATPPGEGGIAVVRLSGPSAFAFGESIAGRKLKPRHASLCELRDPVGELIDRGIVLCFPAPRSFTGEDVVELQVHGGPVVCDWLVDTALALGARAAAPGEFTQRAFLNDKLDLTQAEAVADLIASGSRDAARAALRSLEGVFSDAVHDLLQSLTALRVHIEAGIDYPDDELDLHEDQELAGRLARVEGYFRELGCAARQGNVLRDGLAVVIAGPPNAGKSSLLNQLAGEDAAIVTDIPGTTRDPLHAHIAIDGMPLSVVDTAGLRDSGDVIEAEGMRRAHRELKRADRALWVAEAADGADRARRAARQTLPAGLPVTLVLNKIDLLNEPPAIQACDGDSVVWLSALTGAGLDLLREHLKSAAGFQAEVGGAFSARRRHLDALAQAEAAFQRSRGQFDGGALELAAEELRDAQTALGAITGEFTSEDLLGEIFANFCIGK
jgi:tRNA modification GTPase